MSKFMPPMPPFGNPNEYNLITQSAFNQWYDTHIRPLFANAVEVVSWEDHKGWYSINDCPYQLDIQKNPKRALVINIQPIEEETAEDILREFVAVLTYLDDISMIDIANPSHFGRLKEKAKRFLERKK